ncbi:RagB/SusD family nutrient uptake outer membrane protein [Parabacteroides sp. AF18-52]|jgi:hypothetical protein|uniref:RagB/SusD family nutrient uptake outer membrane protein n=2 Tax=Parabacteroides TaxID=375288 RepID=UPI000F010171|nr:RagB/SusD family nutrient uptake outer membrane protein [Parabacteroides sp. AF18-52]RHR43113.1 RagB/SusD family nutrient uptake outer membrane protein [Parabacteroides sp. AF18-52]
MNKLLFAAFMLLCCIFAWGQAPQAINYQAVARDNQGRILSEKKVSIKLAILQGSSTGSKVFEETHVTTSSKDGVINLQIGNGSVTYGAFSNIDWSKSPYFIRFSMDENGGTTYKDIATTQMLSVPYALYAEKAGNTENQANHMFIVTTDGHSDRLYTGALVENYDPDFRGLVSYLDMQDQDVKVKIEGLPNGATLEDNSLESGPYGRYIDISINNSPTGTHKVTIVMTNKYGITKKFPFTYQRSAPINPEPSPGNNISDLKQSLLTSFRSFSNLNKAIDNAFMNKSSDETFAEFKNKTYTPNSSQVNNYWQEAFNVLRMANSLIREIESNPSSDIGRNAMDQALAVRAYVHLMLTQWFGDIILITEDFEEVLFLPRTPKAQALASIISDLRTASIKTKSAMDSNNSDITVEEMQILLREAYLMQGEWQNAIDLGMNMEISSIQLKSTSITDFIKKIANWKLNTTSDINNEVLMKEYMDNFYSTYNRGNLYLNILKYSAEYFNMDNYKSLLPIPQREMDLNPNMRQNPGWQ